MTLGMEVRGLDLDSVSVDEMRTWLAENGVVILRERPLDDQHFLGVSPAVRRDDVHRGRDTGARAFPDLNVISNVGRTTPPKSTFHVDTTYVPNPPAYTALRAVERPGGRGQHVVQRPVRGLRHAACRI
ncbi:MAG: TauD/TfdA family dioxygenase [Rhodococcus sp. (in: high G+C Gram-positive bacteria)]|nr:TauD/TfdA family dioxygenase [Rhodococcus sp. (in: high G+C Gram-positive bacteria)]